VLAVLSSPPLLTNGKVRKPYRGFAASENRRAGACELIPVDSEIVLEGERAYRTYSRPAAMGLFHRLEPTRRTGVRYIDNEEQHHRTWIFQEGYRDLSKKYHVDFDERYVWA
jgi:hypothetical protein